MGSNNLFIRNLDSCFEKRPVIPKEKRTYKELVIEAL